MRTKFYFTVLFTLAFMLPSSFGAIITSVGGTVSSDQNICYGTQPAALTLSGNVGNVLYWQSATNPSFTSPTTISSTATSLSGSTIGSLTATTYLRAVVQSGVSPIAYSTYVTITITSNNTVGTASSSPTLCINTAMPDITHSVTGATDIGIATGLPAGVTAYLSFNTISISGTPTESGTFNYSIPLIGGCGSVNATGTITVIPLNTVSAASSSPTLCIYTPLTTITHATSGVTGIGITTGLPSGLVPSWANNTVSIDGTPLESGTFTYTIQLTGGCNSVYATGTIIVNPESISQPGSISGQGTVCAANNTTTLQLSGYLGTVQWQSSTDNIVFNTISGQTNDTLILNNLTATTYYQAVVTNGSCTNGTATAVSIIVDPIANAGTISGGSIVCAGVNSTTLTTTGYSGSLQWELSTDGSSFSPITNATDDTYLVSNLSTTSYFRVVSSSGTCGNATSSTKTITVISSASLPTISGSSIVCNGTNSTVLTLSGSNSNIQWQSSSDNSNFTDISGATGVTLTPTNLTSTTYYRVIASTGSCGVYTSASANITVNPVSVAGTIAGGGVTVCSGVNLNSLTLTGNVGTLQWQTSTDNINFTNSSGATNATYDAINLTTTTYFRAVVTSNPCSSATTASVVINVDAMPQISSITGASNVCTGTNSKTLSVTSSLGTIQWQSSNDNSSFTAISGATTNTYTASNLTATTYYRIQVAYGTCLPVSSSVAIIVDPTSDSGTVSGGTAYCSGINSTALSLNGAVGSQIQWQSSANNTTFSNISGANATTYSAQNVSSTTYYRAIVTSGACASSTSASNVITINSSSTPGSISGGGITVCGGSNSTVLTLSGYSGNIQWQSSSDNSNFNAISGANAATYTASSLSSTTYFRAAVTAGTCAVAYSASSVIVVSPSTNTGTISGAGSVCSGTNSTVLSISGNTGSIQWQSSTNNTTFTSITGATNSTYTVNNITTNTYYRILVVSGVCTSSTSTSVLLTVNPTSLGGTASGSATVCSGTNSRTITLAGSRGTIQWQSSTDNVNFSPISGANASTYTATNLTATTYFRSATTNGVCSTANSNTVTITVNPISVSGTVSGGNSVCTGSNTTTLSVSGNTGNIQWQTSSDNITFNSIGGSTGSTYTVSNLTATRYYRVVVTSGVCAVSNSASSAVVVSATSLAGTVSGAGSVCSGTNSKTLTIAGYRGSLQWQSSSDNSTYTNLSGQTSTTYTAVNLNATTYYRVVVTNGACSSVITSPVTIIVNPTAVAGTISGAGSVCSPTNSTTLTLTGYTGNIQWQSSSNNITFTNIAGTATASYTATNVTATTYYRCVVTNNGCTATSASTSITIGAPGDQTSYGNNSWIGYMYGNYTSGATPPTDLFTSTYRGYITQNQTFDINNTPFTGPNTCGSYNTYVGIRFKMQKTFTAGYYNFVIGGDDGVRLSFDGGATFPLSGYNYQGYKTFNLTVYLSGSTNLVMEYFQGSGGYRVSFNYSSCGSTITTSAPTSVSGATTICTGGSTTLTALGSTTQTGDQYQWGTGTYSSTNTNIIANTQAATLAPTTTTTYWVRKTATCGLPTTPIAVTVNVNSNSTVGGTATSSSIGCGDTSTTLSLTGYTGTSFQWQSSNSATVNFTDIAGATTNPYTVTGINSTKYYRCMVSDGVCSNYSNTIAFTYSTTLIQGDQTSYGNNSWIGYVYNAYSSTANPPTDVFTAPYRGYITQSENFDLNNTPYSGTNLCGSYSTYVGIRFKMQKTFSPGYYSFTIGGDDGIRLSVDGGATFIASSWHSQGYTTITQSVYLSGSTNLVLEYYQGNGAYRVSFNDTPCLVSDAPTAITGTTTICRNDTTTLTASGGTTISGVTYQWGTGSTVGSNIIAGQTSASISVNPTNTTTYWVRRVDTIGCLITSSGITTTVTVMTPSVAGTISGAANVCATSNSTVLTLTGNTGSSVQWQSSVDGINFTDIAGANATTFTASNLTTTTYYRVSVTNSPCTNAYTNAVVITVYTASLAGAIGGASTVCSGTNSTLLSVTGQNGAIQWQNSTNNSTFTNITGQTGATYTATNLTTTTYYRVVVTNSACSSATSSSVAVTVTPISVAGTITGGGGTVCSGTNSTTLTLGGYTGGIQWQSSTDNVTFTTISGATATTYTASNLTTTTYYRAVVTNGVCNSVTTTATSVLVSPNAVAGTVSGSVTYCSSSNSTTLTLSGYSGSIQWQSSTNGTTYSNITNATTVSYVAANLATTTYYRALISSGVCTPVNTNVATITVYTTPNAGSISGGANICSGTNSTTLSSTGTVGAIQWQSSSDNSTFSNIVGATGTTFTATNLSATTYYRISTSNGTCTAIGSSIVITVNPSSNAGSISGNTTVCTGTSTTLTVSGTVGGVQWQSSPNNTTFTNITNATTSTYTTPTLTSSTYYRVIATSGVCSASTGSSVTVTVTSQPSGGTITGATTVCSGSNSTTLTVNGTIGTINWQSSPDNSNFTTITGQNGSTLSITNLTSNTYYRVYAVSGICSAYSPVVSMVINTASNAGSITGSSNVCTGTNSTTLSVSGTTGTIQWQSSTNNSTFSTITGATSASYIALNMTATNYYRVLVTNGVCSTATSAVATVVVSPLSVAGTISNSSSVCYGTNSTTISLTGNTGTIQWLSSSDNSTFSPINGATSNTYNVSNLTSTTYYKATVTSGVCSSVNSSVSNIVVSPSSIGGNINGSTTLCAGTNTATLTISGHTGSIQWQSSTDTINFSSISGATTSSFTANNLTTTTYYRAQITSGVCPSVNSSVGTITVNIPSNAGTISGATNVCIGTNSTTLSLTGSSGNIQWQSSTNYSNFVDLSGQNATTLAITNLTLTTYYRVVVSSGVCGSATSPSATVTVNSPSVGGVVSSNQAICYGLQPSNLVLSGYTGGVLKWQKSSSSSFTNPIDIASSSTTLAGTTIGNLTATTYFRAVVQNGVCATANSSTVTIIVTPNNTTAAASSTPTLCINTALTAITHATTGATGIGTASGLPTGVNANWASSTITISGTPTTSGTFTYSIPLTGGCGSINATGTITVTPANTAGIATSSPTLCINSALTAITHTTTGATGIGTATGLPTGVSANWASNTITINGTPTIAGTFTYSIPLTGGCSSANATGTIVVTPTTIAGTTNGDQTICLGSLASNITLTGNVGSVIKWQKSNDAAFTSPIDIASTSATLAGATIGILTTTTYIRAVVQSGVCTSANSSLATITVTNSIGGTVASNQTICSGAQPSDITLSGNVGSVVKWQKANDAVFTNPIDINSSSTTLASATIGNLSATTYFRAIVQDGACSSTTSTIATIQISNATVAGSATGDQTICANSQPANIVLSGNVGSVVKWQKANDTAFTSPIDIASSATTLTGAVIGSLSTTTYFRAVVQSGSCLPVNSSSATVYIITTTWNGTSWSNGEPTDSTITKSIAFTGNYSSTASLYGCVMQVSNNAIVTLNSSHNITLNGALTVDSGSNFTMENDSNFIQNTDVANTGTITVKRNSSPLFRLDYTLWSSPVVSSQTLYDFSPLTSSTRYYIYNTLTNLYNSVVATSTTFSSGKGYLIRMPNNWIPFNGPNSLTPGTNLPAAYNGSFTGVPTNGPVTVSGLVDGGSPVLRYNAVGNPYPSTIKIQDFITQNSNTIDGTVWLWRKTNDMNNMTSYSTCTIAGCTRNNGHTFYYDDNLISVGQGFMVRVKPNQSTLTFTNSMRIADNVDQFFRTTQKDRFWLDIANSTGAKYGQLMLAYVPNGTTNYDDGIDGVYINDSQTALTSVVDGKELTINARPLFDVTDVAPVQFRTDSGDTYTISINRTEGVFSGNQDIFIRDNQLGTVQSLKDGNYTFASTDGTFTNRFDILYQNPTLATNAPKFNEESVVVYKNNGSIHINAATTMIDNVKIFDIRGRLIIEKKKVNATQTSIDTSALPNQVLLVQITSDTQSKVSKKVVN